MKFKLKAPYSPAGDQAQAIEKLTQGILAGKPDQVLLGVTGSGKTYTVANVIEKVQKPTLVISHNKTLAAQLYQEFKEFFPDNGVGFFVSYYDYYQPEAYIPQTDTYVSKEADINEEIDKLRLQATSLLFSRTDLIIVASVSCIYNIGSPKEYGNYVIELRKGLELEPESLVARLVELHYTRSKLELSRGTFRVRGDLIELQPAYTDEILKITFKGNKIIGLEVRPIFMGKKVVVDNYLIYPAKHFLTNPELLKPAFGQIRKDLNQRLSQLEKEGNDFAAHRLEQRVNYDLEMIQETGYVNGIENYSRYFDGRKPGEAPWSLVDYFIHRYDRDFLLVLDESHMGVPQIRGMYKGDLSRKQTLIEHGFRLPSCLDNRPLKAGEFWQRINQTIYLSATPAQEEIEKAKGEMVEQLIRPTGLVDPEVFVRPAENQIKDLVEEIVKRKKRKERVLVTTLTKKMAEELSYWLANPGNTPVPLLVHYLHSDVATLERTDILADLRGGKYDVIVGVNLLREGLDLPEVSLVAILDADKQGFLRSKTALIQTMGRAARHVLGQVILYADTPSVAMLQAIGEVERRRTIQLDYNQKNKITPRSIQKPIRDRIVEKTEEETKKIKIKKQDLAAMTPGEQKKQIPQLRREMRQAAAALEFEKAAAVRDLIRDILGE